jgi:trk system potassium uptake protein TrkH
MRPQIILRYNGFVLLLNAVFFLLSALVSLLYLDSALYPLLYSFIIAVLFGIFPMLFVPPTKEISNREGFTIVITSWLLSCLIGGLPYVLWGGEFTFTNAWFESVSGYTTTGSSILTNVQALPPGLLFWRSSTHWIGGIGILIFVLSVSPYMGKAGMILYRTEMSPLAADNFHYRTKQTLNILLYIYVGLTVAETISLLLCGVDWLDAVIHAFGTIATGGFSSKNLSIAYFNSLSVEIVVMVFMVLSGMHFGLLFAAVTGKLSDLRHSSIVRYYLIALFTGVVLVAFYLNLDRAYRLFEAFRYGAFQVLSVGTSTGFATADSAHWPPLTQLILIFFTLQCACAGSTSGGIKTDRIVLLWKAIVQRLKKIQHPSAVILVKIDKATIDEEVLGASMLYIALYLGVVFLASVLLTAFGVDLITAFSGAAAAMGNVGPGLGSVGSLGNYSQIPEVGKWILSAVMLLGRLEIFGLLLFLMSRWWR